jgi:hypothetical protein
MIRNLHAGVLVLSRLRFGVDQRGVDEPRSAAFRIVACLLTL